MTDFATRTGFEASEYSSMQNALYGELQHGPADPLAPAPPEPPFYDSNREAWVLSRYVDVLAALREPRLSLRDVHVQDQGELRTERMPARSEILSALSAAKLAEWQMQIEPLAYSLMNRLPACGPVEIIREFARPWSVGAAVIVTGANAADTEHLEDLARQVSEATADPSDSLLRPGASAANTELERYFKNAAIPMSGPTFVALSQTLPCFLANAWLALLRHPAELARLSETPELMPRAIDELLRYAGLARKVSRQVTASISVAGIPMTEGERAILVLASANRDPEQFPDPNRLDFNRGATGQVALGTGWHACVGGALIRMAAGVATRALVPRLAIAEWNGSVEWRGGSGFRWASSLDVLFRRNAH